MAPSFADTFYNNVFKHGLLLAKVETEAMARVLAESRIHKSIRISLAEQTVSDHNKVDLGQSNIEKRRKIELLNGMDEIDTTTTSLGDIKVFELRGEGPALD